VSEIILNEPRVRALVGEGEAASVAEHMGMGKKGQGRICAVFSEGKVEGRAVQRLAWQQRPRWSLGRIANSSPFVIFTKFTRIGAPIRKTGGRSPGTPPPARTVSKQDK